MRWEYIYNGFVHFLCLNILHFVIIFLRKFLHLSIVERKCKIFLLRDKYRAWKLYRRLNGC